MIVIDKETNKAQVIDFAIPYDNRVYEILYEN